MSWYVGYDKLSQKQLEVLNGVTNQLERTHWLQGFAGTGKTLVLTHLIERVAKLKPDASLCFITFTHALKDLVATGLQGAVARRVEIKTHTQFLSEGQRYDFVFLDEVQDIKRGDLDRIKHLAAHLCVAGDPDQRIYREGATSRDIDDAVQPRAWKLLEIFRLTRLLQRVAQSILPHTRLIEGLHAARTADVTIRLVRHADSVAEAEWVWSEASRRVRPGDPCVILFPTHKLIYQFGRQLAQSHGFNSPPKPERGERSARDYGPFNEFWRANGLRLMYFGNSHGELARGDTQPMVYLMTYHSSKGLDFRNVFIPRMGADAKIVFDDALADDPDLDRRLLFVAVTRSRENLFISYSGRGPHRLLDGLPDEVVTTVTPARPAQPQDDEEFF